MILNTITELQALTSIPSDNHVHVLGYYAPGDGGSGDFYWDSTSTADESDGTIYESTGFATGRWFRFNLEQLNVKWFGAKGDGVTDDTEAIREAIFAAFELYTTTYLGWKGAIPVFLPSGKYLVTDSLITSSDTDLRWGRFYFSGAGSMNTEIVFQPSSEKYLFDNNQIFGFTTFEGLGFRIDTAVGQKFMNFAGVEPGGGDYAAVQGLTFKQCAWRGYKNIMTTTGGTMGSEVIFSACRIFEAQTGDCMFEFSNSQAMNWRFFGTDIEPAETTIFRFKGGGGCINIYQGSIIIADGKVIHVPEDGEETGYGDGNWPSINFWGSKFELHDASMLVHIEDQKVNLKCNWYGCGMGMYNTTEGTVVLKTMASGTFNFDNCYGFHENWKAEHTLIPAAGIGPVRIIFVNNCPAWEEITSGNVYNDDFYYNAVQPIYTFENCGPNRTVKPFNKNSYSGPYHKHVTTRITTNDVVEFGSVVFLSGLTTGTPVDMEINVPDGEISFDTSLAIKPAWIGGYGGMLFTVNVYNDLAKTQLIGTGTLDTDDGIVIKLSEGKPLYFTGKIVVEFTAAVGNWSTDYRFEPHIIFVN